jgi:Tripartite tricarboxylate transporter family receptor
MFIVAPMLVSGVPSARATDWPAKPVTVVVGYAAGGNTDVMARMASKKLSEVLKQSFVVENRIGAGGALAAAYVAQAALDGYTLFFAAAPQIAIVPQLQKVIRTRISFRSAFSEPAPSFSASIPRSRPRRLPSSWPTRRPARSTMDRAVSARSPISPARCS